MFAFELFDEDQDALLTRRGIWRFIRSFLCVLVAISSSFENIKASELSFILDDLSVLISSDILANNAKRASFEMIVEWYNTKGSQDSTWIELLDLKKWIAIPDFMAEDGDVPVEGEETEDEECDESDEDESNDEVDEEEEEEGYQYPLSSGHTLVISESDTAHVLAVAMYSGLCKMDPDSIVRLLARYSTEGVVIKLKFLEFFNELTSELDLPNDLRNKVLVDLFNIYTTFEERNPTRNRQGVDFRCLAVGLTFLCAGSKSAKLEVGLKVFAESNVNTDDRISRKSLSLFLESYLLVFASLKVIKDDAIAIDTALSLSEIIGDRLDDNITFTTFGNWYNEEGYSCAPWIELLSLSKWEKLTGYTIEEPKQFYEQQNYTGGDDYNAEPEIHGQYSEEEESSEEEENSGDTSFNIILFSHEVDRKITVSKKCANRVHHFTRMYQSNFHTFSDLVPELHLCSQHGLVHKKVFLKTLGSFGYNLNENLHSSTKFMEKFFDAFDRARSGFCDIFELVTGLVVLEHDHSKSEKLVYAFDLFCEQKNKGALTKREIFKFFRSFLISVVILSVPGVQVSDHFNILADESAVWLVEDLLAFIAEHSDKPQETPSSVKFDDIVDWYKYKGYQTSAWIELLDLKKWINYSS